MTFQSAEQKDQTQSERRDEAVLSIFNASKVIGKKRILNSVTLQLYPGRVVAILGRSGSGKTSLVRAISLVEPPDEGCVCLAPTKLTFPLEQEYVPEGFWPTVSVVFQDLFLWPHMTCQENIELAGTGGTNNAQRAQSQINALGIEKFYDRYPNEVSRGQRQLVALARAFAVSPKALILDEVTSSLDIETALRVGEVIRESSNQGTAMCLVSHDISFISRYADEYVYMSDGKIVEHANVSMAKEDKSTILNRLMAGSN